MIWGCQWDATLRWMKTSSIEKVKNFSIDSELYGNYCDNSIEYVENGKTKTTILGTGSIIPTGSSEITNINNIYDMAGNVEDYTRESMNSSYMTHCQGRIARGGSYFRNEECGKWRSNVSPSYTDPLWSHVGSRSCLYIN